MQVGTAFDAKRQGDLLPTATCHELVTLRAQTRTARLCLRTLPLHASCAVTKGKDERERGCEREVGRETLREREPGRLVKKEDYDEAGKYPLSPFERVRR